MLAQERGVVSKCPRIPDVSKANGAGLIDDEHRWQILDAVLIGELEPFIINDWKGEAALIDNENGIDNST